MPVRPEYPAAPRLDISDTMHGTEVHDPYRWLEDGEDTRTREWLTTQAALMDAERNTWSTREHFVTRVGELLGNGSISPSYFRGVRRFFTRRNPDQQFPVLYVAEGDVERVLIDPMELNADGSTTLDSWQPSKDGHLLAYQLSEGGTE